MKGVPRWPCLLYILGIKHNELTSSELFGGTGKGYCFHQAAVRATAKRRTKPSPSGADGQPVYEILPGCESSDCDPNPVELHLTRRRGMAWGSAWKYVGTLV